MRTVHYRRSDIVSGSFPNQQLHIYTNSETRRKVKMRKSVKFSHPGQIGDGAFRLETVWND